MQHDKMVARISTLLDEADEIRNDDQAPPSIRQLALVVRDFLLLFRDQVVPAPAGGPPHVGLPDPAAPMIGLVRGCAECGCCIGTYENFRQQWLCSQCADGRPCRAKIADFVTTAFPAILELIK